ncbi:uncharacterized protein LOC125504847 [Dendroctonus ponderosae]|uniref:uncharacterized protein LOC125504847 n=1 Tax=Dendroctonus ponderosae TaxID=77166 RepID=UPI0020358514|nr:uncharacterized protein LOC125504847 [Dendroctonus ponderosae]
MAFKVAQTFGLLHFPTYLSNDVLENYRLMKECLFSQYIIAILRKNSVLLTVTNTVVSRMKESGIITYWVLRSESTKSATQRKLRQSLDGQYPENLKLLHVLGAFVVLLIGLFLASILFCIEICKSKEVKKMSKF